MTLSEFRASHRLVAIESARKEFPFLDDMDLGDEFTHCHIYAGDGWMLESRRGIWLALEGDEYQSRDLALLEFILWLWIYESAQAESLRRMIWE